MATYKLIQDIEAEDHILGPLTLRQFIFAMIAAFCLYICFIAVTKHFPLLLIIFLPPALFCTFFAFPWGRDQPTEVWALAKLRFLFKPRRRIWNQSGLKELVTITAPKKVERILTDNLSQTEVKSRLQALAETIDSRGWAIKHISAIGYVPSAQDNSSDRLINIPDDVPPPESQGDMTPGDDVMDADNPVSRQFQTMIDQSSKNYRQKLMTELKQAEPMAAAAPAAGNQSAGWFMSSSPAGIPAAAPQSPAQPQVTGVTADAPLAADDKELSAVLKQKSKEPGKAYGNMRTLQPLGAKASNDGAGTSDNPAATGRKSAAAPMTAAGDPAILSLSKNDDLNVATIAREAQRAKQSKSQDEVVISLH